MNVLIYYPPNKLGMSDFNPTDYTILADRVKNELDGKFPNFGNKVWLQAIMSEIYAPDNTYEFGYDNLSADYINQNFDCVLCPLANCFHEGWIPYLKKRASHIKQLKIPVYVIACGVQAKSYDDLNNLVEATKEPATEFITSVYNTGGEFALRGYFTAEYFKKLGFNNAVVTGCPSAFQMGRELCITEKKVNKNEFVAAINGSFKLPITDKDIKNSDFICQDIYGKFLYDPEYFISNPFTLKRILKYVKRGDYNFVRALANNKIKLFADTPQWMSYYVSNNISFSFGTRIHGTIMPILSGVPSMCVSRDAKTREMVEFFDIPHILDNNDTQKKSLYEWYCETDYNKFNQNFAKRYDDFEAFLNKCGLITKINQNNILMNKDSKNISMPTIINDKHIQQLKKDTDRFGFIINPLNMLYKK